MIDLSSTVKAMREVTAQKASHGLMVKASGWHDILEKNYESYVIGLS